MSRLLKRLIVEELRRRYADVRGACVVSLTGMDANTTMQLRRTLREHGARMEVVKNRLAKRAFADGPLAPLAEALAGPCALVTGDSSVVDVAKLLVRLAEEYPPLELKFGLVEGDSQVLPIQTIAKMKSWSELMGELAGLISGPGRALAGAIAGPAARLAGCIKAIGEGAESEAA